MNHRWSGSHHGCGNLRNRKAFQCRGKDLHIVGGAECPAALTISEHGYVMESGKIVLDGPAAKLIENEDVREFYMG